MNTTRDVLSGSDRGMPSGCEVEAATFHAPVRELHSMSTPERSGLRDRIDSLKSRGLSKVHDVQHVVDDLKSRGASKVHEVGQLVTTRSALVRTSMQRSMTSAKTSMRSEVDHRMSQMQSSMRTKPALWAGVAAGSGFALGMAGRFLSWRNRQHRHAPQIIVIDAMC